MIKQIAAGRQRLMKRCLFTSKIEIDLKSQALIIDPVTRRMTDVVITDCQTEIPRLIGSERFEQIGNVYYDAHRVCHELFAGNCERITGPYLKIDHVHLHIHSKAIMFPIHERYFELDQFAVWEPQKGLFRRIWSRRGLGRAENIIRFGPK